MPSTPQVSIVIPCFNAEDSVGDAIRSALAQTYSNVEVIVVDDGSTDGSANVIQSFGDAIRREIGPHRGGCAARNGGMAQARGEFIQFLDADDLLHPDKLERQVPVVLSGMADVVFCNWEVLDLSNGTVSAARPVRYDGGDPLLYLLSNHIQTSAPIHWKRHLLAVGGFRENLRHAQDTDLHVRLACSGLSFHQMPEILYAWRRKGGSVSSNTEKVFDEYAGLARSAVESLCKWDRLTDVRRKALAEFLAASARWYLERGLPGKARDYFAQATRIHPDGGALSFKSRVLYRVIGPVAAENLARRKRAFFSRSQKQEVRG